MKAKNAGLVLTTPRLQIRRLRGADLNAHLQLESDRSIMRFITGRPRTAGEVRKRLLGNIRNYKKMPGLGVFGVFAEGRQIGNCNLLPLENTPYIHLGYKLHPDFQGKGLATEIAKSLLRYALLDRRLKRVTAVSLPENKASRRVLMKAGLAHRGFLLRLGNLCAFYCIERTVFRNRLALRRS